VFDRTGTVTESLAASSAFVVPNVPNMTIAAIIDNRTTALFIAAIRVLIEQGGCISAAFLSRERDFREWDGPAALPPPTTLRVLEGLIRRRSTPCLAHPRFTQ
jgi:hypothetical protein